VVEAAAAGDTTGKASFGICTPQGVPAMGYRLESLQDSMAFTDHPVVSLRSTTGYGAAKPSAYSQASRLSDGKML